MHRRSARTWARSRLEEERVGSFEMVVTGLASNMDGQADRGVFSSEADGRELVGHTGRGRSGRGRSESDNGLNLDLADAMLEDSQEYWRDAEKVLKEFDWVALPLNNQSAPRTFAHLEDNVVLPRLVYWRITANVE
eukprot:scaffold8100_cov117-Isochrysis_galbana.AAC.8